jgi:hypothetical protein
MAKNNEYYLYETFGEKSKFFFDKFPYIDYDILGDGEKKKIKNFFRRFDFRENVRKFGTIYTKWVVRDEDTPQIIAHKLYNSTHYYWVVLMINQMIDPMFDFPMTDENLTEYVDTKYGVENRHAFHHWESIESEEVGSLPAGIIVDDTYPAKHDIDNYEYELKLNDKKRHILLLEPLYLPQILTELENILTSRFTKVTKRG